MLYEKDLLDKWTEYSVLKTAEEKGIEKGKGLVVTNLLAAKKFTIAEIANFGGVTEAFVKKVKVEKKK
jgi:hypothetical protein